MIDIWNLIWSTVKGLAIGIILLAVSLFVLPKSWVIRLIRVLRPGLIKEMLLKNDNYFEAIIGLILDGKLVHNFSDNEIAENKLKEIEGLKEDLRKIESNMFTIDLLVDLFGTLSFALTRSCLSTRSEIYSEIANYFSNYTRRLSDTSYRHNFADDIIQKFESMASELVELEGLQENNAFAPAIELHIKQQKVGMLDYFLKKEKETLKKNRNLVVGTIKSIAYELMGLAKE